MDGYKNLQKQKILKKTKNCFINDKKMKMKKTQNRMLYDECVFRTAFGPSTICQ